jgi:hypothetical protein
MEPTIFTEIDWALQVNDELSRLNADTGFNAHSGLAAESVAGSEAVVKIFDDYDSGEYYADRVIEILGNLEPIDWDEHDNTETAFGPIWDALASAEV